MIDLGVRLAGRTVLVEVNGFWLTADLSKRRTISLEFGRVRENVLEPVERDV